MKEELVIDREKKKAKQEKLGKNKILPLNKGPDVLFTRTRRRHV